jgi:hypothetical protein
MTTARIREQLTRARPAGAMGKFAIITAITAATISFFQIWVADTAAPRLYRAARRRTGRGKRLPHAAPRWPAMSCSARFHQAVAHSGPSRSRPGGCPRADRQPSARVSHCRLQICSDAMLGTRVRAGPAFHSAVVRRADPTRPQAFSHSCGFLNNASGSGGGDNIAGFSQYFARFRIVARPGSSLWACWARAMRKSGRTASPAP